MFGLIPWKKKHGELNAGERGNSLAEFRSEFDHMMANFFDRWSRWPSLSDEFFSRDWRWDIGLHDEENEFVLRAEAPGFEPNEFDVRISGNQLIVEVEHKKTSKGKNGNGYQYGKFYRTVTLPAGVEQDKIQARYHNGVLEVHLPKGEQAKSKRITVKAE